MVIQRTRDVYTGMYDFAVSGGAIGTIDLQIPVPANSLIIEFVIRTITVPLSGGAATISFDQVNTSVSPVVNTIGQFRAATVLAGNFDAVNLIKPGVQQGVATAIWITNSFSIGMSIAVAALTAGKIVVAMRVLSFDF